MAQNITNLNSRRESLLFVNCVFLIAVGSSPPTDAFYRSNLYNPSCRFVSGWPMLWHYPTTNSCCWLSRLLSYPVATLVMTDRTLTAAPFSRPPNPNTDDSVTYVFFHVVFLRTFQCPLRKYAIFERLQCGSESVVVRWLYPRANGVQHFQIFLFLCPIVKDCCRQRL